MTNAFESIKKYIRTNWFSLSISIAGLIALVVFLTQNSSEFFRLNQLSYIQLALLSSLVIILQFCSAKFTQLLSEFFDVHMTLGSALALNTTSAIVNIIPFGAVGFRALFLKRVYGVRYLNYGLMLFCNLFAMYVTGGIIGLIGVLFFLSQNNSFYIFLFIFGIYIFGSFSFLAFLIYADKKHELDPTILRKFHLPTKVVEIIASILQGFSLLKSHPKTIRSLLVTGIISQIILSIKYWLIGYYLGYGLGMGAGVVINSMSLLASVLPIPNGVLGLQEAISALSTTALGISTVSGVMIAGVDRVISFLWNFIIGFIGFLLIRKKIAPKEDETEPAN